jgi:peptidoglycan/LPS O-acetylase OafA/YrhL
LKLFFKDVDQNTTIPVLDGVRAFACLSVIAYHIFRFTLISGVWSPNSIGNLTSSLVLAGYTGVTLFFILSGFLLFMPYIRSLLFDDPWPSMRRFYLRRVFRILPGYYVSLVILILLTQRQYLQPAYWKQLALFLTLLMDSNAHTYQAINGPYWTLAVEWQFYMILPFFALLLRWIVQKGTFRWRLYKLWGCVAALAVWGLATRYWGRSWQINPHQPALLPPVVHNVAMFFLYGQSGKFMEDFAVGMFVSTLYVIWKVLPEHRFVRWLLGHSWLVWGIGVCWLFLASVWPAFPNHAFLSPFIGAHNWLCEISFAIGYGICMTAILFGQSELQRMWAWLPLRRIGALSYGMYIWHLPLILLFMAYVLPWIQNDWHTIVFSSYWVWVILIVIPFSYLFYRFIELPWMEIGRRVTRTRSPLREAVVASKREIDHPSA